MTLARELLVVVGSLALLTGCPPADDDDADGGSSGGRDGGLSRWDAGRTSSSSRPGTSSSAAGSSSSSAAGASSTSHAPSSSSAATLSSSSAARSSSTSLVASSSSSAVGVSSSSHAVSSSTSHVTSSSSAVVVSSSSARPSSSSAAYSSSSSAVASSSSSAGVVTDPFNLDSYCQSMAEGTCARWVKCSPQTVAFLFDDEFGCQYFQSEACSRGDNGALASIVGVSTRYNQAQVDACKAATSSAACDDDPSWTTACRSMFVGTRGTGASCWTDLQCLPTYFCSGLSSTVRCGTCQARAAENETCSATKACLDGLLCVGSGGSYTCKPESTYYVRSGSACTTTANSVPACRGEGNCVAPDGGMGTCQVTTTLAAGAACATNDALHDCPLTQECVRTDAGAPQGRCTTRPGLGEACDYNTNKLNCTDYAFCSAWESQYSGGTCQARRQTGGDCSNSYLYDLAGHTTSSDDDFGFLVCDVDLYCADTGAAGAAGNTCQPVPLGAAPAVCP